MSVTFSTSGRTRASRVKRWHAKLFLAKLSSGDAKFWNPGAAFNLQLR
ncbi:MAG: hypothetical protein QXW88_07100 [Thermofilum sp.]